MARQPRRGGNSQVSLGTDNPELEAAKDRDTAIIDEGKHRFDRGMVWEGEPRRLAVEDTKFANGDSDNNWQWPDGIRKDRDVMRRPCLTINKTKMHVLLLANEARQNPPSARVKPVGEKVSYEAAETWEGIVRHIEYISDAKSVYTHAKQDQLEGGIGYWHVKPDYEDDRSFDQEIRIEPLEASRVLLDCDIKRVDGSDAMWGFIFDEFDRKEFRKLFPNVDLPPISTTNTLSNQDTWIRRDAVRVAQYYRIQLSEEDLIYLEDDGGNSWTGLRREIPPDLRNDLPLYERGEKGQDFKKRTVMERCLQWFKIAGNEIIDRRDGSTKDCPNLKGRYVPIVRMPGRERTIEGRLYRAGLVRGLKDAQRMYNYNCLSMDTPLPTPTGWTTMREVQSGDFLISDTGRPTKVLGVSPVKEGRPCFTIEFDTGCVVTADDSHLWTVEERGKRKSSTFEWSTKTVTTDELDPARHLIRAAAPIDLPDADLPVPPYVLGAWLGDGSARSGIIHAGVEDAKAMHASLKAAWPQIGMPHFYKNATAAEIPLYGLAAKLREAGVLNRKHIPAAYHRASRAQREELLRGLMDTDGHITKNRQCVFVNTNEMLVYDVEQLARSLGLKVTLEHKEAAQRAFPGGKSFQCVESWYLRFTASPGLKTFHLPRKLTRQTGKSHWRRTGLHRIRKIVPVGSVPVKCVMVDAPSKLFLAGWGMIPTHNTSGEVEVVALQTKTPWIVAAEAIEGNESAWKNANTTNAAYLTFRAIADDGETMLPKPERMQAPQPAQGFLEGLRIAAAEMEMASGQYQGQVQATQQTMERSPKAVDQRQRLGELANYDFTYNEMQAVRHTAIILIDLIPHYYDTQRTIKIKASDNAISEVMIDPDMEDAYRAQQAQQAGGKIKQVWFNPKIGKYAVEADIGPTYQTQREEAWEAGKQVIAGAPELMNVIGDLVFLAADWPMADKIAERIKRNIEANAPWLLEDGQSQTGPAFKKLTEQMQATQGMLSESMEKLAEARLKIKGQDEKDRLKAEGRDIEVYDAQTRRLTAEGNVVSDFAGLNELGGLKRLIEQTVGQMLGFSLEDIEKANKAAIKEQSAMAPPASGGNGGKSKGKAGAR